jgi:NAD+ diphosphatase
VIFAPAAAPVNATLPVFYIPVRDNQLLCPGDGIWRALSTPEFASLNLEHVSQHFIGHHQHCTFWAVEINPQTETTPPDFHWLGLRSQLGLINEDQFTLAGSALQVLQWDRDHRFCGRCGSATYKDADERVKVCSACEFRFYPRVSPCIITLITRGNECLLALHARASQPIYTALAGFIEIGERPEDTLHREVYEEVGVEVKNLRYAVSQPWPFPGQLMLGFYAEYARGEVCVDGTEILDAQWYRYDQLPRVPPLATLSGQLIAGFVKQYSR